MVVCKSQVFVRLAKYLFTNGQKVDDNSLGDVDPSEQLTI